MPINIELLAELKHEAINTRKMIESVPQDKLTWKPHEKSMAMGTLATHIAMTPIWFQRILNDTEFDFLKNEYRTVPKESTDEILKEFDKKIEEATLTLQDSSDDKLMEHWTLRNGDTIYFTLPRKAVLRNFAYNHIYHHRGQLSVYLRLLDIKVPGMYGPSADEKM